jgi:hypothetical protein
VKTQQNQPNHNLITNARICIQEGKDIWRSYEGQNKGKGGDIQAQVGNSGTLFACGGTFVDIVAIQVAGSICVLCRL